MSFSDVDITDDVVNLFKVINYLDQQMSDIFAYTFEKELALLKAPDVIMTSLLDKIQREMDSEVSSSSVSRHDMANCDCSFPIT